MTRAEVNDFIKSAVDRLKPKYSYGRGRLTEFNSLTGQDKMSLPAIWFETVTGDDHVNTELAPTTMMPLDEWPIRIHVARKNEVDAGAEDYEAIIDECDAIAQTLQFLLNQVVASSSTLTISGLSRSPFVKAHSTPLTGVLLSFTLRVPDRTDQSDNCD